MRILLFLLSLLTAASSFAATGTWNSPAIGRALKYTTSAASVSAAKDANGKLMTIIYLENLGVARVGTVSNAENVKWLCSQGYQVIELDYEDSELAVLPTLNADIIAINKSLKEGSFCGSTCSPSRSYILMEGYRIQRDISYYHDDPTVYNFPDVYKDSNGDELFLDLIYPASPAVAVPVIITFSYSNSYATNSSGKLTNANKHMRMNLYNFWGNFNDSFVEGASAAGFAWAVCDHPKYCEWGQGRYTGGGNKSLGAIEVNPDTRRKVRSAIRTVRALGRPLGLNGDVAVTGFSRASTAAALAVGDGDTNDTEDTRGRFYEEDSHVQCALLGPGIFDYEHALPASNEYTRMNTFIKATSSSWQEQGALSTIKTSASAPTLFYYNADDYFKDNNKNPQGLYATQASLMKAALDAVGAPTATLTNYSSGHAVPQSAAALQTMYDFLFEHIAVPDPTGISAVTSSSVTSSSAVLYDLLGRRVTPSYKGFIIRNGRLHFNR